MSVTLTMSDFNEHSFLAHHGILGMKWGIRRYQNKDGSLTSEGRVRYGIGKRALSMNINKNNIKNDKRRRKFIRYATGEEVEPVLQTKKRISPDNKTHFSKGTKVQHVTTKDTSIKPDSDRVLFVAADEGDKKLYSSVLAASIMKHSKKPVKAIEFELKEDLKAPSKRESIEIFKEQYSNNKKEFVDYFSETLSRFANNPDFSDQFTEEEKNPNTFKKRFNSNMKKSWLENDGYQLFIMGFNSPDYLRKNIYRDFRKEIETRGYNSIVDDNDSRNSVMGAKVPIIILNEIDSLGKMTVRDISKDSIIKDYNDWVKTQKH